MSDIKEHEINKQENLFIRGYYAPDDVLDPLIKWCRTLPLIGGVYTFFENQFPLIYFGSFSPFSSVMK